MSRPLGLAVTLALAGAAGAGACGPQLTPEEPPQGELVTQFWLGDWVVDTGALPDTPSFTALSPEAQATARAVLQGSRWRIAFDTRRAHLPDGRLVPFELERQDATAVVLVLSGGAVYRLTRRPGGLRLETSPDGDALPLRRASE